MEKKIFKLTRADGSVIVELRWGTYAMKLFTDYRGITFSEFITFLSNYSSGIYKVSDIILFIRCGAEYAAGGNLVLKDIEIAEWIDEVGGPMAHRDQLQKYFEYICENTLVKVTELEEPAGGDTEKKTLTQPGTTL
jgi:hypothetical protein